MKLVCMEQGHPGMWVRSDDPSQTGKVFENSENREQSDSVDRSGTWSRKELLCELKRARGQPRWSDMKASSNSDILSGRRMLMTTCINLRLRQCEECKEVKVE